MSVCKLLLQLVFGENHKSQTTTGTNTIQLHHGEVVWFSLSDYWEGAVVWFSESDVINCPGSRRLVCEVISRIIFQLDQIDHFKTCNIAFQVIFYIFRGEESAFNDLF